MPSSKDFVRAGQEWAPPTAALQNSWTQASIARTAAPQTSIGRHLGGQSLTVYVKSTLGVDAGTVVGFGEPLRIATNAGLTQAQIIYDEADPVEGRWGIATVGIAGGDIARVVFSGLVWAQVNVLSGSHTHADIVSGVLTTSNSGYAIIRHLPSGVGTKWCLLQLGCCGSESSGGEGGWENPFSCANCTNGTPDTVELTLSVTHDDTLNDLGIDWETEINKTHTIELTGCSGSLVIDTGDSTEEDEFAVIAIGTPTQLVITFQFATLGPTAIIQTQWLSNGVWQTLDIISGWDAWPVGDHECLDPFTFDTFDDAGQVFTFVSGSIEQPTPPPPISYSFTTLALLEAATLADYLAGEMAHVTADGVNNGYYIALGEQGGVPVAWHFLADGP